jgi:hypothetical protein
MDTKAPDTCRRPLNSPDPIWRPTPPVGGKNRIKKISGKFQEAVQNFFGPVASYRYRSVNDRGNAGPVYLRRNSRIVAPHPADAGRGRKGAAHHAARACVQIAIGCSSPRIDCGAWATSG